MCCLLYFIMSLDVNSAAEQAIAWIGALYKFNLHYIMSTKSKITFLMMFSLSNYLNTTNLLTRNNL